METANISITKEQMSGMPQAVCPTQIIVADTPETALAAAALLSREPIIGFDTETRPSFRKGETHTVALLQLSTLERTYLFRLNRIGMLDEIRALLESESLVKVGLSTKDDFKVLSRIGKLAPAGFVELQTMVRDYGIADGSLQKIYAIMFGQRISKGQRLTNWEAERLTESQCQYAAMDAWACLKIYNTLKAGEFDPAQSPYVHTDLPTPAPQR